MFLVAESGEFEVITRLANMVAQSWVSSGSVKAEKWRGKTRLNGAGGSDNGRWAPAKSTGGIGRGLTERHEEQSIRLVQQ